MIPKIRVFAEAGVKSVFGGGYDTDQMFYEIRDIDFYDKEVTVWGCHRKDCGMCDDTYRIEDVEIMMSTWVKDKDGVEIYEGDIVAFEDSDGGYEYPDLVINTGIVEYGELGFYFTNRVAVEMDDFYIKDGRCDDIEVLGNIYENPELIVKENS